MDANAGQGAIRKCVQGKCTTPLTLASFSGHAGDMAVNSAGAFWTPQLPGVLPPGPVMYCPFGGCMSPHTLVTDQYPPTHIAVDSTNAYWIDNNDPPVVMRCPVGGCGQPITFAVFAMSSYAWSDWIAVGSQDVYWTDATAGTVVHCPLNASCQPTFIASGEGEPEGIGLDSTNVYWVDSSSPAAFVKKCPLMGCTGSSFIVASQPVAAYNFTVGPTALYWSAPDGKIMKVAK
jgi:hypothetical protein